jgi:hypothetical protein
VCCCWRYVRQLKIRTSYKPVAILDDRLVLFMPATCSAAGYAADFDLVIKLSQPFTP